MADEEVVIVHGLKSRVTVMRADGTPWILRNVKHIILKPGSYAFYLNEHGQRRKLILMPDSRIDHCIVEDEEA